MKNGGPLFPIESTEKASLRSARRISGRGVSREKRRPEMCLALRRLGKGGMPKQPFWGLFLDRSANFSGLKANFEINTF